MELLEDDYILGYWFASDKDDNCWYQMIIKRDDKWMGQYTFRYNESADNDDPFSGKDRKNIYSMKIKNEMTEDEIIEITNIAFELIKKRYTYFSDMFLIQGNIEKFFEIAKTKYYLHF